MSDRIDREIEDIIRKLDDVQPGRGRPRGRGMSQPFASAQAWLMRSLARVSLRRVMTWALFAVIVAFSARGVPGATWVMLGGLIVFVTAYLLSRGMTTSRPPSQKSWRGQPIDLSGPGWAERIRDALKGRKRR